MEKNNAIELIKKIHPDGELVDDFGVQLETLLKDLSEREEAVIRMLYGLDDGNIKTHKEVAQYFGVRLKTIQSVEEKAIKKLRHPARTRCLFK